MGKDGKFVDVSRVVVHVRNDSGTSAWLDYPLAKTISFDTMTGKTLSVSFTPSQSGAVNIDVGIFNQAGLCLGRGTTPALIKKGDVAPVIMLISQATECPTANDGGAPDASIDASGDGVTFPGCDPANPGAMCGANQTCFVNCVSAKGMCIAAGNKGPGEICSTNADCMPGTQCFNYSGLPGCGADTKICQKFCNSDAQCAAPAGSSTGAASGATTGTGGGAGSTVAPAAGGNGGGGAGGGSGAAAGGAGVTNDGAGGGAGNDAAGSPGTGGGGGSGAAAAGTSSGGASALPASVGSATCRNAVVCSANVTTSYRTCSFACDPRGDATLGCPKGLMCFLYRDAATGIDSPDCGCRDPSRTRTDGMGCTTSADCIPGHVCNMMAGTQLCRKLCKVGAANDCTAPKACSPLSNTAFGVCVGG